MPAPWDTLAEVCLLSGLRVGEAMALRPQDVDLGRRELHVRRTAHRYGRTNAPKSLASERVVPLSPRAADLLRWRLLAGAWPSSDYRRAYEALRVGLDAASLHGPGLGWYWFRNAYRSLLREASVELETAARRMATGRTSRRRCATAGTATPAMEPRSR
jgi:integrase